MIVDTKLMIVCLEGKQNANAYGSLRPKSLKSKVDETKKVGHNFLVLNLYTGDKHIFNFSNQESVRETKSRHEKYSAQYFPGLHPK